MTASRSAPPAAAGVAGRLDHVDWLRIGTVAWIMINHCAVPFMGRWYVSSGRTNPVLAAEVLFGFQWHLPLLFLLAGLSSAHALRRRSAARYVGERAVRLLVPLVFGTLVLIPPIVYAQHLAEPGFSLSYLRFYPAFFDAPYPRGNFQWGHLWFLAYLMVLSVLLLPLFRWLAGEGGRRIVGRVASVAARPAGLLLMPLPFALVEAVLRPSWPGLVQDLVHDVAGISLYALCMTLGFVFALDERFEQALDRRLAPHLVAGVAASAGAFLLFAVLRWPPFGPGLRTVLLNFVRGLNIWFWVAASLALGRRYLTRGGRALDYLREASYPLFILHLTAVVWAAYFVTRLQWSTWLLFPMIVAAAGAAVLATYELAVRPWRLSRLLMGMRPTPAARRRPA